MIDFFMKNECSLIHNHARTHTHTHSPSSPSHTLSSPILFVSPSLAAILISISMDVLSGCSLRTLSCVCACLHVFVCADRPAVEAPAGAAWDVWKRPRGIGKKRGGGGGRLRTQFPSAVECLHACSCLERQLTAPRSWQETTCCLHWGR